MSVKDKHIELFNKIRNLFPKQNRLKLSKKEIEYLAAIIILELDKGKRMNTLAKINDEFINSIKSDTKKFSLFKKTIYDNSQQNSNIDKKI